MAHTQLTVLGTSAQSPVAGPEEPVRSLAEVRARLRGGRIVRDLFRYSQVRLLCSDVTHVSRPFEVGLVLRLLARRACWFEDDAGHRTRITIVRLAKLLPWTIAVRTREAVNRVTAVPRLRREIRLAAQRYGERAAPAPLDLDATAVYLFSDLVPGLRAGGSVGHIAGVLNNLDCFTKGAIFITSGPIPTVREDIPRVEVTPGDRYHCYEHRALRYHDRFVKEASRALADRKVSFIYQRYAVFNFSGVVLARRLHVPLVIEFNGSEVWAQRNWGNRLRLEGIATTIEDLNTKAADLVVVVSEPIRDDLVRAGVEPSRILVNPNGVDPDRYHPGVDGSAVRARYGLDGKQVIGFIGTFGRWHGAEVLAEAFGRLLADEPHRRESTRLLLVGEGVTLPEVRDRLAAHGIEPWCVLTGRVDQEAGPAHLAACDVLASPHVPNADGTPFFGSPTKLFEYMAMGRAIVASSLGQIAEVIEDGRNGRLVPPGDPDALRTGIATLLDDADLRDRLGQAARDDALTRHTWKSNTERVVDRLRELHA